MKTFGNNFGKIVEVVGGVAPLRFADLALVKQAYGLLPRLFSHMQDIMQRLSGEKVSAIFKVLTNQTYNLRDRWEVITSFEVGTLEVLKLAKGTRLYRWSSSGELGRYFSTELISEASVARKALALPNSNSMKVLAEYHVAEDVNVIVGKVAQNFGQPGGGTQVFLSSGTVKHIRDLK